MARADILPIISPNACMHVRETESEMGGALYHFNVNSASQNDLSSVDDNLPIPST
jgi:hypothetical protein